MKISKITISSILGLDELEFSPEGFTMIEGPNGTGKTSVLEAIKGALQHGHDATLLRNGAEKGEIVLVLDDGMSITKTVCPDKSSTDVRGADGKKVGRPAEAIKALTDMMSINPVAFLTAEKKDRVRVLLESMPLDVDAEALTKISGIKVTAKPGMHALHVIDAVHKQVYDDRTGTNRAVKEKAATISQLTEAMPAPVAGVEGSEEEIEAQVAAATTARDTTLGKIRTKLDGIKAQAQVDIEALRARLQADIDALKAEAQGQVDVINAAKDENVTKAAAATEAANTKHTTTTTPLTAALAAIRTNRSDAAKREKTVELIEEMNGQLEGLRAEAEAQTQALTNIETYKSKLLSKLPIKGLEVRDGEIFIDGVVLDRVNTAGQVRVAVGIAKLRAGELGLVCLDRVEALDSTAFEELREQISAAGLQCFVTRVSDDEFAISTQD